MTNAVRSDVGKIRVGPFFFDLQEAILAVTKIKNHSKWHKNTQFVVIEYGEKNKIVYVSDIGSNQ